VFFDFNKKIEVLLTTEGIRRTVNEKSSLLSPENSKFCKTLLTEGNLSKDKMWMDFVDQINSWRNISFH